MIKKKAKVERPERGRVRGRDDERKGRKSAPSPRDRREGGSKKQFTSSRPSEGGRPRRFEKSKEVERRDVASHDVIYGVNSVLEAFRAGRGIEKVILAEGRGGKEITEIINQARGLNLKISYESRENLSRVTRTEGHQGVAAIVSAGKYSTLDDILKKARDSKELPFILILDGIQDPQNLGAIIRTAVCAGVHGIIIPKDRAVGLTGTVDKTSAGALSHISIAKATNIAQTIDELKRDGFWVIGAYRAAKQSIYSYDIQGPLAVVVGSEGEGIRPLVAKKCDMLVSIPIRDKVSSLNASAAAAIIMFEVVRQRGIK